MNAYTRSRLLTAVKLFNDKEYFECHEVLEDIWFDVRDNSRDLYQGLLHASVALYHLTKKNNLKGTLIQLKKAEEKLGRLEGKVKEIDLTKLLGQLKRIAEKIQKKEQPKRLPKIIITLQYYSIV